MLLTFGLLGAAIIAVWLPDMPVGKEWRLPLWLPLFVAASGSGVAADLLDWPAIAAIAGLWIAAWASSQVLRPAAIGAWTTAAALLALALATHRMPGFLPAIVASEVRLSTDSASMTLRANFDKGAAGLLLLAYCCHRTAPAKQWASVAATGLVVGTVTAAIVISLVRYAGAVHFAPKLPQIALEWVAINLLLTCVMEEALFRGILQDRLARSLVHNLRWRYVPIAVPSVLFGLVHFGGGPVLVAAATLAGLGYGVAYAKTGRVEAAVIAHFVLNSIHFFGFTYPYAVR